MADISLAQLLQQMPSDMDGYSEQQAQGGRYRDPAYRSGAAGSAIAPWELLVPGGLGAAGGAFAGRALGRAGATMADIAMPSVRGIAPSAQTAGRMGGAYGGAVGGGAGLSVGYDAAIDRRLDPQMPPMPQYPRRAPDVK